MNVNKDVKKVFICFIGDFNSFNAIPISVVQSIFKFDLKSLWPITLLVIMWSMAFAECLVTRVGLVYLSEESYYSKI